MNRLRNPPSKTQAKKEWSFDERDIREDIKLALPSTHTVRYFQVVSGDSGEPYMLHLVYPKHSKGLLATCVCYCSCRDGQAHVVAAGFGLYDCKHGKALIEFLRKDTSK